MRAKLPLMIVGFLVMVTLILGGAIACPRARAPTPTPKPPLPTPAPTPPPAVGMKVGERFHDVHTNKLQLKCDFCHVKATPTYNDPLAQVSNPADNRVCLSCHKEGGAQPFYGEEWNKAKVGR